MWLPIPGYEGMYDVSDRGVVRSYKRSATPRVLHPSTASFDRRYVVFLCKDGKKTCHYVHQLVLLAFVGPRPDGLEVCHLDGNSRNNELTNLEYNTRSKNTLDKVRHGTHAQANKTHCPAGHEYTESNTMHLVEKKTGKHRRRCRTCHNDRSKKSKE